jgi:hypothetical protein
MGILTRSKEKEETLAAGLGRQGSCRGLAGARAGAGKYHLKEEEKERIAHMAAL